MNRKVAHYIQIDGNGVTPKPSLLTNNTLRVECPAAFVPASN
jgi:hypothetical protein